MSDAVMAPPSTEAPTAPVSTPAPARGPRKKSGMERQKVSKAPSDHPKYAEMIKEALTALKVGLNTILIVLYNIY